MLLAPFFPSHSARGGAIILPIVTSTAKIIGSEANRKTRDFGGSYLHMVGAMANPLSSSVYFSSMAANPYIREQGRQVLGISLSFFDWLQGNLKMVIFKVVG
jgi:DASS family divalent anion:Na+ symporter